MTALFRVIACAVVVLFLCTSLAQKCSAEPEKNSATGNNQVVAVPPTSVTIPFTALRNDANYRPHQLVTIGIRKDPSSPVVPATFMFDTGTNETCISASLAQKLNLPQYDVIYASGSHLSVMGLPAKGIRATSLEAGGLHIQNFRFAILPDRQLLEVVNQPIDGILGFDFWSSFATHVDFARSQITFLVPSGVTFDYDQLHQNPVRLSDSQIAEQGFSQALVVPLTETDGRFLASVVLRNEKVVASAPLLIDSGSDVTFISEEVWHRLSLKTIFSRHMGSIHGKFMPDTAWVSSLVCGGLNVDDLLVSTVDTKVMPNPHLGLDVLANYDVLLDFPHRKMYLKPRADLQVVTSRQYEAASPAQRRHWAQKTLAITYASSTSHISLAIPYDLTADGLPLAQARPDLVTQPVPFLLKSNTSNTSVSDALAHQWKLAIQVALDEAGKPRLEDGRVIDFTSVSSMHFGGASEGGQLVVLPADGLLSYASYLSVQGIIGANILTARPLLMDPATQTWMQFTTNLSPEDLPSLYMADASVVDILDPDGDGIPAVAVQMQRGATRFTDTMTLATGSPFTLLSAQAAQTLNLTAEPRKLKYGAGKDITVFNQAHLSQISIGGVVLKDVLAAYPDGAMPDGFSPRLGMNIISRLRLLVDVPAKKMYVKLAEQAAPPTASPAPAK